MGVGGCKEEGKRGGVLAYKMVERKQVIVIGRVDRGKEAMRREWLVWS